MPASKQIVAPLEAALIAEAIFAPALRVVVQPGGGAEVVLDVVVLVLDVGVVVVEVVVLLEVGVVVVLVVDVEVDELEDDDELEVPVPTTTLCSTDAFWLFASVTVN